MKTIVISIGNSDNKLTQIEWSKFVARLDVIIAIYEDTRHFFGGSENWKPWQNVAWMIDIGTENAELLRRILTSTKQDYNQDSIAWLEGETEFI